ncbi:MAG: kinase-like domain-containing protein [Monoraphidium minutum]|nr:MAG: kinase-like domain-containing protein [Monoraphidium minutum]
MRREIGVTSGDGGVDELQLLELMDEGTYGKVFRGLWRGSVVAIKTMILPAKMSGQEKRERMAIMEAAISSAIQHPNVVQTFTYVIKPSAATSVPCANSEGDSPGPKLVTASDFAAARPSDFDTPEANAATVHNFEVSLVLEWCDWGSLRTALDEGAFFAEDNSLNYAAILDTAADIARAMVHLHKNNVLHSDLKVRNVLLKSDASPRGCTAKVADFGLAVRIDCMDTHVSAFQGTMSHMAPEALLHGRISKAGDVYSFGVTLWELFTAGSAYQGVPRALIGHQVAVLGLRPPLPPFTPAEFRALVEACWAPQPEKRPTFDQLLPRLVAMRQALSLTTPPLHRYQLRPKKPPPAAGGGGEQEGFGPEPHPLSFRAPQPAAGVPRGGGGGGGGGARARDGGAVVLCGRTLGVSCGSQVLETISDTEVEEELTASAARAPPPAAPAAGPAAPAAGAAGAGAGAPPAAGAPGARAGSGAAGAPAGAAARDIELGL